MSVAVSKSMKTNLKSRLNAVMFIGILLLSFSFTSLLSNAMAYEFKLVSLISEPENNLVHDLILNLDDQNNNIINLIRRSKESQQAFTIEDLINGDIVLAKNSGYDAIKLRCGGKCDNQNGGQFILSYLYSGISRTYHTLLLKIVRNNDVWEIYSEGNVKVRLLRITPRKFLGKVIGVNVLINV